MCIDYKQKPIKRLLPEGQNFLNKNLVKAYIMDYGEVLQRYFNARSVQLHFQRGIRCTSHFCVLLSYPYN